MLRGEKENPVKYQHDLRKYPVPQHRDPVVSPRTVISVHNPCFTASQVPPTQRQKGHPYPRLVLHVRSAVTLVCRSHVPHVLTAGNPSIAIMDQGNKPLPPIPQDIIDGTEPADLQHTLEVSTRKAYTYIHCFPRFTFTLLFWKGVAVKISSWLSFGKWSRKSLICCFLLKVPTLAVILTGSCLSTWIKTLIVLRHQLHSMTLKFANYSQT